MIDEDPTAELAELFLAQYQDDSGNWHTLPGKQIFAHEAEAREASHHYSNKIRLLRFVAQVVR